MIRYEIIDEEAYLYVCCAGDGDYSVWYPEREESVELIFCDECYHEHIPLEQGGSHLD